MDLRGISTTSCPCLILSSPIKPSTAFRNREQSQNIASSTSSKPSNLLSQKHFSHLSQSNPTKTQWPQQCTAHLSPAPPALPTPPSPLNHQPPPASAPSIPAMVKAGNSQPHTHHPVSTPKPSSPSQPSAGPNTVATQEVSTSTSQHRTSSPSNRPPARRLHSRAASTPKTARESISRALIRATNKACHGLLPPVLGDESARL
jgi:hypothetical protein